MFFDVDLCNSVHLQYCVSGGVDNSGCLTGEHGFEVVAGGGHDDPVNREGLAGVAGNQDDITQGCVAAETIQTL